MAKSRKRGNDVPGRHVAGTGAEPARWFATAAFAISLIALLVSAASLVIQWRGYKATVDEVVAVSLRPWSKSSHIKVSSFGEESSATQGLLEVDGEVRISNNGSRSVSITQYELWTVSESAGKIAKGSYLGLDGGLFDSQGKQVDLPLYLEPGESKVLCIRVAAIIPPKPYARLKQLTKSRPRDRSTLLQALTDGGMDAYGNAVEVVRYPGGGVLKKFSSRPNPVPRMAFSIRTGQENEFWVESDWDLGH